MTVSLQKRRESRVRAGGQGKGQLRQTTRTFITNSFDYLVHLAFRLPCCSFRGRNEFANHLSQSQNSHLSFVCPTVGLNYYNVHINIPEEEHCKFNHLTLRFASEGCCAGWSDCCASISSRFILMEASHCSQS